MKKPIFCTSESTIALVFAKNRLQRWGYTVNDCLDDTVTHLLLPVPSPADSIPADIPQGVTVLGGRLPELPYKAVDLLQDTHYLQENAAITAECAMILAKERMAVEKARALVIGWGRIGKCLASALRLQGAQVSVAARKPEARRQLRNLGFDAIPLERPEPEVYDLIFNTAPAQIADVTGCKALCIDLASVRGLGGDNVLWARGLPGKMAPEASGALIAKTALRYALKEE